METFIFSVLLKKRIYCVNILQARNVSIVVIGVGRFENFREQLEEIASEEDSIYNILEFDDLSDLFIDILEETCSK